jgi:prepilin-type N-terminal cleavage/methylation domain-containing protein
MSQKAGRARGFSIIELMVTVAIVGILTSVALPNYQRMNVRTKTAERGVVMGAILRGIEDIYRRTGSVVLTGIQNPVPPPGMNKKNLNAALSPDWVELLKSIQIDGPLYYSYSFNAWEGAAPGAWITAIGDLDGDGVFSVVTLTCPRVDGLYQCTQTPVPGAEDVTTF